MYGQRREEENVLVEFLKRLAVIALIVGAVGVSGNSNAGDAGHVVAGDCAGTLQFASAGDT